MPIKGGLKTAVSLEMGELELWRAVLKKVRLTEHPMPLTVWLAESQCERE